MTGMLALQMTPVPRVFVLVDQHPTVTTVTAARMIPAILLWAVSTRTTLIPAMTGMRVLSKTPAMMASVWGGQHPTVTTVTSARMTPAIQPQAASTQTTLTHAMTGARVRQMIPAPRGPVSVDQHPTVTTVTAVQMTPAILPLAVST